VPTIESPKNKYDIIVGLIWNIRTSPQLWISYE